MHKSERKCTQNSLVNRGNTKQIHSQLCTLGRVPAVCTHSYTYTELPQRGRRVLQSLWNLDGRRTLKGIMSNAAMTITDKIVHIPTIE